ncbi:MAG: TIGR01212 family radical SAM protein, partial [Clostridia bacterium]|nr:TIGR01212 family radical SAM protein [Clostridia bacterium]
MQEQMKAQAGVAARKWKDCAYIAYFQSYTNTYAPVEKLTSLFDEALSFPETVGLAVATRCDCLPEAVLELLTEYNRHTYLWVELGLQTASDQTGDYLRRGFKTT